MSEITPVLTSADVLRAKIHEKTKAALRSVFPLDLKGRTLELEDVRVHDKTFSPTQQRQALLTGSSLNETVKGTLVLKDADGKVVDRAHNFTLAHIPHLTERHTLISDGNEYQIANQLRRKPGVYTQRADNGELRTVFNLGRGQNFDIGFNEAKGTFQVQYGTTNLPLYGVLRGLGATHEQIAAQWGAGVAKANQDEHGHQIESTVTKLYGKLEHPALVRADATQEEKVGVIQKRYGLTTLDPEVTKLTLGREHDKVTPHALLDASAKMLRVHKGEIGVDDTDSLAFKTFHSMDDFLAERIRLTARAWAPKAKRALQGKSEIRKALHTAPFSESIRKFVTTSSLSAVPTGINPMELIDHAVKVTSLGEGGIPSDRAIPMDARMIHNTHFGALDPIRTPESSHSGVDIRATIAAHRDDKGNLYTALKNVKSGQMELLRAGDQRHYVVAFPHQQLKGEVDAFVNGQLEKVDAKRVTHQLEHIKHAYSPATTLIPFIHSIQGTRAIMASKMGTQALPLKEREVPLVQVRSHLPGGESFEELYGHMVVPVAPVSGTVRKIDGDYVYIEPHKITKKAEELLEKQAASDGLVKVPYQTMFPFPSKTALHHEIDVKPGDKVQEGQRLGDSNYTRQGTLALGKNLLVGYMPYYGYNSNDAMVISEGASKKLTSEHVYREVYPVTSRIELNREKHKLYYGPKYQPAQYAHLDADGVVKKGSKVNPKDILVAGLTKQTVSGADALVGRISKALTKPYKEVVLEWGHGTPGEVVDVVRTDNQITVLVRTSEAMQIGDKLCYSGDTDVLTETGWKPVHEVTTNDRVATLQEGVLRYDYPSATHAYATGGRMYHLDTQQVDLLVTEEHRMLVAPRDSEEFTIKTARDVFGKRVRYKKDARWEAPPAADVVFPALQVKAGQGGRGARELPSLRMSADAYAMLLGAFLSEGNCVDQPDSGSYGIDITQVKEPNRGRLLEELDRHGLRYSEHGKKTKVRIYSKQLLEHFKAFGHAHEKYLPPVVFSWDSDTQRTLFHWLMWGDGHAKDGRPVTYTTTSPQLADDVQRLMLHIGYAANVQRRHTPIQVILGRTCECRPRYDVRIVTTKLHPQVNHGHAKTQNGQREAWIEDYQAPVYCLTVPGGVLYVRRNGKPVWSGNCARYGNKGVVAKIVPDHEMLRDEQGRPIDLLITSAGVISRINPAQIIETAVSKVAEKTGKPIVFDNASGVNAVKWAQGLLKEHGIKDKEHVFDPVLKRHITGSDGRGVLVGKEYIYKLFKSTDTNFAGHGVGPYDLNEQPLKTGGDDSAKGLGKMEFDALLAHNARNFLNESASVRGTKNDEFWKAVQLGLPLPAAKPSFAFNKFTAMLEGAGVRIDKRGSKFHILPLTDKDVAKRSAGAIENNKTLQAKDLKPEKGGLFDPARTGGPQGTLYAHIDLHEPIPSPVFKEPVRRLLGLTEKGFDNALGEHGGSWFKKQLDGIDPVKKLTELREKMKRANGPVLNDLVKQVKYLEALKTHGMTPSEAYIISKVPVIPPVFRPILPGVHDPSQLMVADANKLYAQLMDANHTLKNTALESDIGKHRNELFSTVEELYGTTLPRDPKLQQQKVKGYLSSIAGVGTPKGGFFQRKLMRRNMDVSGRGTAVPDVNLGMDEVGIPEKMLWGMLEKLVVARLIRKGYPALQAKEMVNQKAPAAREALLEETRERPMLINRAPTLHRWSVVAAYAKPVAGKTIRVSSFTEKGLNLDYDGNCFIGSTEVYLTLTGPALTVVAGDTPMKFGPATTVVCRTSEGLLVKTTLESIPYLAETKSIDRNGAAVYELPSGMRVWSYAHDAGMPVMAPITGLTIEENCAVAEVETQRGFKVTASTNDSLCVYDHDAEDIVSCKPEDALECLLPVMRQLPCEGTSHDFEHGWMLGAFLSDGFLQGPESFGYTKVSDLHRERFAKAVDAYEGKGVKRTTFRDVHEGNDSIHGASVKDHFYHAPKATALFAQCFVDERIDGRACLSKSVPDLSAFSFDALVGLLAGLLDGAGSLSVSRAKKKPQVLVNFSTSAPGLVEGLEMLCNLLSIRCNTTTYDPKAGRLQTHRAHIVNLSICDVQRYVDRLFTETSLINDNAKDAASLLKGKLTDLRDLVPVPHRIMAECTRRNGACRKDVSLVTVLATTKSSRKKAPYVSRATAERMLNFLRLDEFPGIERWAKLVEAKDVQWDVIKTATPLAPTTVYDLVVPSTKVFAVNGGMVVWDTLQVHAPITPGAIDDAKKMTLSSMLLSDQQRNKILAFPQHDAIIGFTLAAKAGTGTGPIKKFNTPEEAKAAWRAGKLKLTDTVEIAHMKTAEVEDVELPTDPDLDVSLYPAGNVVGGDVTE